MLFSLVSVTTVVRILEAMDRQDELLEQEDGRYFAIDKFGTGLASVATSERLGRKKTIVVSFGLPSGPALFLHLAYRAFSQVRRVDPQGLFDMHPQGRWPDRQGPLFDYLENCMAHAVFSFTAIEAFANEVIPDAFTYTLQREGKKETLLKPDIERRINLDEKLDKVLPAALSVSSPKNKKVWEEYRAIKRIRNRLIHIKSVDRKPSGPEDETIWGALLKAHGEAWCDSAHAMIGHFKPAVHNRR